MIRAASPEGRALLAAPPKRTKYFAKRTVVDGVTFASAREAREYSRLRLLERRGDLVHLECQPVYVLHAPNGTVIGTYVADFRYEVGGQVQVIDVKGMRTLPLAKWKQKHLAAEYGIRVQEVR